MRRWEDTIVGDELPVMCRVVTAEDVRTYAEAGGDRNPLHLDDAFARSVGFDGIIAHGMFTMGHMARCVVDWAGGDPANVIELSAQFRTPVYMGDTIEAGGSVLSVDSGERTATVQIWVRVMRDGLAEWPIKRGTAVVRLLPPEPV
jgi:meromycolic acid (3R)-3-hydroxyacyl-[acyl-carrier protein] dehydratase HadB